MKPSQAERTEIPPGRINASADWLAWSLKLVLGIVVGGAVGGWLGIHLISLRFIGLEQLHLVIAGGSLFVAGFAAGSDNGPWVAPSIFTPAKTSPIPDDAQLGTGKSGSSVFSSFFLHYAFTGTIPPTPGRARAKISTWLCDRSRCSAQTPGIQSVRTIPRRPARNYSFFHSERCLPTESSGSPCERGRSFGVSEPSIGMICRFTSG